MTRVRSHPAKKNGSKLLERVMIPFIKREKANESKRLDLWGEGKKKYHLSVVSTLSDARRMNASLVYSEAAQSATGGGLGDEKKAELTAKLCACSVIGWDMPKEFGEFTQAKAEKLLFDYPQICDAVDRFSSEMSRPLEKK